MKQLAYPFVFWSRFTFFYLTVISPTQAQVIPDGTLPNNSIVTPDGTTSVITGGTTQGGNLFHSFEQFSVSTGNTAYFNNSSNTQNIIGRVTGSSASTIEGSIKANFSANLFLLNPNGVIFGPNASLNVGGSFIASTAESLVFEDGTQFSADTSQTTPLLTVSVPIGLQFGETAGKIVNQSSVEIDTGIAGFMPFGLQVQPGKTLALVGGDVSLEGGGLYAPGGRIELGSVADNSLVGLNPSNWTLDYSGVKSFQDIPLSQGAYIEAGSTQGGGSIQVQGRDVSLQDGSLVLISTLGAGDAGDLVVHASDSIELGGSSFLFAPVQEGATGSGGNLTVETDHLILQDGSQIGTDTAGAGNAGDLFITAKEVELSGFGISQSENGAEIPFPSGLLAQTEPGSTGDAGNLTIEAENLTVQDGAQISASTKGSGNGGNLIVHATEIELTGEQADGEFPSGIFAQTGSEATGDAGNLTLETEKLIVQDGGQVSASTFGSGNAGNLTVYATEIELSGISAQGEFPSGLFAQANQGSSGNAGNLTVETGKLTVQNGATVAVKNLGTGDAGNLDITADSVMLNSQGKISATSNSGNGGNITLQIADTLLLRNNSEISTTAGTNQTSGNGGNISINAPFIIAASSENSDITANAFSGRGGFIQINTQGIFGIEPRTQLTPLSDITAFSQQNPDLSGVVEINTPDVDPSQGIIELPTLPSDASRLISQDCFSLAAPQTGKFVVTGRGGLPATLQETVSNDTVMEDWGKVIASTDQPQSSRQSSQTETTPIPALSTTATPPAIVEAQGWVINTNGDVILVGDKATSTSYRPWQSLGGCSSTAGRRQ
jgi:filamentous hemagglutinin family protein